MPRWLMQIGTATSLRSSTLEGSNPSLGTTFFNAVVAQLVERWTENPGVASSSLADGTKFVFKSDGQSRKSEDF